MTNFLHLTPEVSTVFSSNATSQRPSIQTQGPVGGVLFEPLHLTMSSLMEFGLLRIFFVRALSCAGIKPQILCMLNMFSTPEQHHQPLRLSFQSYILKLNVRKRDLYCHSFQKADMVSLGESRMRSQGLDIRAAFSPLQPLGR